MKCEIIANIIGFEPDAESEEEKLKEAFYLGAFAKLLELGEIEWRLNIHDGRLKVFVEVFQDYPVK